MVKKQMLTFYRLLFFIALIKILSLGLVSVNAEETFSSWLSSFKKFALTKGVSQSTLDIALKDVKYLEQVIGKIASVDIEPGTALKWEHICNDE